MDFNKAVKNIERSLIRKKSDSFGPLWIKKNCRSTYFFIIENIKTELGETDWDKVMRRLDYRRQKLWLKGIKIKKGISQYENQSEVEAILTKYQKKLYTFLVQKDKEDKQICDLISIRLVRTAQKGNSLARQKAMILIRQLVNQWIDGWYLKHWRGYDDLIEKNIERCICRYRYSGSFIVYLYRTLEYSGRGLRLLEAFSLDDYIPETTKRKSENLVYDSRTGETRLYSSKKHRR